MAVDKRLKQIVFINASLVVSSKQIGVSSRQ